MVCDDTIAINTATTLKDSTIYGGGTSATLATELTAFKSPPAAFLQGNADNDTFDIAGTSTSTTIKGGQGTDFISRVGSVGLSYLTGNKGSDTVLTGAVANNTSIWGGSIADTTDDAADGLVVSSTFRILGFKVTVVRIRFSSVVLLATTAAAFLVQEAISSPQPLLSNPSSLATWW